MGNVCAYFPWFLSSFIADFVLAQAVPDTFYEPVSFLTAFRLYVYPVFYNWLAMLTGAIVFAHFVRVLMKG